MLLSHQDIGEGIPIMILHGLFGSLDNWRTLSLKLSKQYRVLSVDLRNHGHSFHHSEHTYEAMAEDIHHLASQKNLPPFILVGHSMGGKAAMYFALNLPDSLTHLVVADIAPRSYPPHHNTIIESLLQVDLARIQNRNEVDSQLAQSIPEIGVRQFLMKGLYRTGDGKFAWRFNLKVLAEKYNQINVGLPTGKSFNKPTLFMRGEKSKYILDEDLPMIQNYFPNADLVTIPNAGHWIHAEAPDAFLATLEDFLQ